LKLQLTEIEDKSFSREAHDYMIRQLEQYIIEINKASPNLYLSRRQGMILENELFAEIVRNITYLVIDRVSGIRVPAYLKYTTDIEDAVDTTELITFLEGEIRILRALSTPNYLKLQEYKDGLTKRIREQFIL